MIEHSNESQHDVAEPVRVVDTAPAPEAVQRAPAPIESSIAAAVGTGFSAPPATPRVQRKSPRPNDSSSSTAIRRAPSEVIMRKGAGNNTGLPDNLKSGIERLSGMSMDGVKVHYNSSKPAQVQAHAYAMGTEIHIAPGQEQHLPHEAWHVVQQAQGRVAPTKGPGGVPINDDAGLEAEADKMGAQAADG